MPNPGSSPLARGLRADAPAPGDEPGIIPARAGFTFLPDPSSLTRTGSSPLARGLLDALTALDEAGGIIPARAGFTCALGYAWSHSRDHPRSRGVYPSHTTPSTVGRGSSPLARGLPGPGKPEWCWSGIIPARAGFTPAASGRCASAWDHPRSRGVYLSMLTTVVHLPGSSPLARGLLISYWDEYYWTGIIPARAGFTPVRCVRRACVRDHPRSRGVYARARLTATEFDGSSPLARGLRLGRRKGLPRGRIIPARAGFTQSRPSRRRGRSDHPRSRGVYVRRRTKVPRTSGSSPLARGLR